MAGRYVAGRYVAGLLNHGRRRWIAVLACLISIAALLVGAPAGSAAVRQPLRVLQLNLCDSGIAGCYTGRSVTEAAEVIRAAAPDVVTLNEICQPDLAELQRTLAGIHPGSLVRSAFQPALDRRTGGAFQCRGGQPYGIGIVARTVLPAQAADSLPAQAATDSGIYPVQDTGDPEERAWLCLPAVRTVLACTTHLASTSATVALAQCRYLLGTVLPAVRARDGYRSTVLGGDLNLRTGGTPDARSCVPAGYLLTGDGGVQHVLASPDFRLDASNSLDMAAATDHPGLLVVLG